MVPVLLLNACIPNDEKAGDPTVEDADGDGLTDAEEAQLGTDPEAADTDEDGHGDADEVAVGTNPASV
ncbi:MAG: hypothetical protein ACOZNI_34780, partial [Myxococcota bacterium]